MRLIPHEFNGFLFQQDKDVASDWQVPYDWTIDGINTNNVPRSQNFPQFTSKNYAGELKIINVTFSHVDCDRDSLVIAMDVFGEDQHQLIANDNLGRAWYINAVCIGVVEDTTSGDTASFGVAFEIDDPVWKLLIPSTLTINVNGTGAGTVTPLGNQPALPVITITPIAGGGVGFAYKKFIQITNNSARALTDYPLNLTGAGLDTAALVAAGKMLANGDDLRIYVDGVEVKRWFGGGGINSTTTKIWINWTQPAKQDMTLGTAIAATGAVATIQIQNTAGNVAIMPTIAVTGNVLIGTEIFIYTGVNVGLLQLTGCTRASKQTTAGAHSVTDAVKFVTHDVWMYYGYSTISPYVVDDTYKPLIKLTSTNTSWIYEEFGTVAGLRTGKWYQAVNSDKSYAQSQTPTGNTDPWQVMGIHNRVSIWNGTYGIVQPIGVTHITATGYKYLGSTCLEPWPTQVRMTKSINGLSFAVVWTETAPSPLDTWVALDSHSSVALGGTYFYIEAILIGTSSGGYAVATAAMEYTDITLTLDSSLAPTITFSAEAGSFYLNSVVTNSATGFSMSLAMVISLGAYLTVNTKDKTITLYDGTNQINALQNMPVRAEWFPLLPAQANLIDITDAGEVTYKFDWEDRSL